MLSWNSATPWKVLRDLLLPDLERESVELYASHTKDQFRKHIVNLTFEEIAERTRCGKFPEGLDLSSNGRVTSGGDSQRSIIYEYRVEIADDHRLFFAPDHGVGINWTSNPVLGYWWAEEMELDRELARVTRTEKLAGIAQKIAGDAGNQGLGRLFRYFRRDARTRLMLVGRHRRDHAHTFEKVEQGLTDVPPEKGSSSSN